MALAASAATHAVLPLLATRAGLRLQLDAGIRSHRRRFGWDGGFWLPECAYAPGLGVAAGGARGALVLRRPERPRGAAGGAGAGRAPRPGRWRCRSTGRRSLALVARRLSLRPRPRPVRRQIAARDPDLEGRGRRLRPGRGRGGGAAPGRRVPRRRRRAAARATPPSAAGAACSSSRSTPSCSATGGRRGRSGCAAVLEGAEAAGVRLLTVPAGAGRARAGRAAAGAPRPGARARTCGPGTRPRSPTSPGARGGWSCGCCGRSRGGLRGRRRAAGRARAARRPGQRLGLPRPARPGGRLRLPARHRSRRGDAGGHRLRRRHRSAYAFPRPGPEPRAPAGALDSADRMTRVLILSWEYPPLIEGGLARHVRKLSEALVERDVEVHVLTRGGEESPAEERRGGVDHPPHPRAAAPDRPGRVRRLGRADELRHARRRGRARRPLQLRPRPRPRLAGRQRLRPPRHAASRRRW